jgi:hypothetical protein
MAGPQDRGTPGRGAAARVGSGWILFACLLVLNLVGTRPYCNWDALAYTATVYAWEGNLPDEVHALAYAEFERVCPSDAAGSRTAYEEAVAASPTALAEQLPFYTIKPIYPALIWVLNAAGLDPMQAGRIVSVMGYVGVGALVMLWLRSFLRPLGAATLAWLLMSLTFAVDLARLSTPDGLSTAVVLAALYAVFLARRPLLGLALLVGSVAIRPDNLFWLAVVAGYLLLRDPPRRAQAVAAGALGLALYVGLSGWSGAYGWTTQFHHTFVERLIFPATFEPSLGLLDYAWIYLRETHPANQPLFLGLLVLVGGCAAALRLRAGATGDPWTEILFVTAAYMAVRWLFWPEDDRLFAAAYFIIVLTAVRTAFDRGGERTVSV